MRITSALLATLVCSTLAAADPDPEPSLEPIMTAVGYGLDWEVRQDNTLVMTKPSPVFARIREARVVPFGPQGRISALDMWLHGSPFSVLGLAFSGGRDLASCGDAALYARRLGWDLGRESLINRMMASRINTPRVQVERLLAFRLLQGQDPQSLTAPVLKAGISGDPWLTAATQPSINTDDPAEEVARLSLHQDVVFVVNPSSHPALQRGSGAGAGSAVLGMLPRMEQRGIDPEFLATMHWEVEGTAVFPIEFAARYGNLRLDRVVGSVSTATSTPQMSIYARGTGLDAVGRCATEYGCAPDPQAPGTWKGEKLTLVASSSTATLSLGAAPTQAWLTADQARVWGLDRQAALWIAARGQALKASGMLQNGPLSTLPIQPEDTVVVRWGYDGTKTTISCSMPEAYGNQVHVMLSMGLAMARQAAKAPSKGPSVNPAKMLLGFPLSEPVLTSNQGRATVTLTLPGDFCTGHFPLTAADYQQLAPDWSRRITNLAQQAAKPVAKP